MVKDRVVRTYSWFNGMDKMNKLLEEGFGILGVQKGWGYIEYTLRKIIPDEINTQNNIKSIKKN